MPYNQENWRQRVLRRQDLTANLVHMTREGTGEHPRVLLKILLERRLIGSRDTGFICGSRPAVCFQDAPIYSVSQNVRYEQELAGDRGTPRYHGLGLAFPKPYLYRLGARPVVYEQTEVAKRFLPQDEHWRIVRLDLCDDSDFVDWTHEREWRLPGDLDFSLDQVTIIGVYGRNLAWLNEEYRRQTNQELIDQVRGVVTLADVIY